MLAELTSVAREVGRSALLGSLILFLRTFSSDMEELNIVRAKNRDGGLNPLALPHLTTECTKFALSVI